MKTAPLRSADRLTFASPTTKPQTWWTHIFSGLVRDPSGKHYRRIGSAIWLYLFLLTAADWKTGSLFRKIDTIVEETGFSRRSVARWLGILRKTGYIKTNFNGRFLYVSVTKWRSISRKRRPTTYRNV
jgi:DNA-binding transcriptional ArsR family regulator